MDADGVRSVERRTVERCAAEVERTHRENYREGSGDWWWHLGKFKELADRIRALALAPAPEAENGNTTLEGE